MITKSPHTALIALIASNAAPLFAVVFADWSLFQTLVLYWIETAIIGFYTVIKLIKLSSWSSLIIVPVFLIHYGGFMVGHLFFLLAFFENGLLDALSNSEYKKVIPVFVSVAVPATALLMSHGISFFSNFIGKEEYKRMDLVGQMTAPYKRVVVMHLTIVFGAMLVAVFDEPILGLVFLIVIKTVIDVMSHLKEHATPRDIPKSDAK